MKKQLFMKPKHPIFLLLVLLLSTVAAAQQPANDYKGHVLTGKGQIQTNGTTVGTVSKEGIIRDAGGKKIAFLQADGTMKDAKGNRLGRMAKNDMAYYNEMGELVFTLKERADQTCDVVDTSGTIIGNVHDSMKGNACALHCFETKMGPKPAHSTMKMNRQFHRRAARFV